MSACHSVVKVAVQTASQQLIHGAIAQLGERLVCIQEVCGSIPHGSTISLLTSTNCSIRVLALAPLSVGWHRGLKQALWLDNWRHRRWLRSLTI